MEFGRLRTFGWCVGLVVLVLSTACGGSSGGRIAFVTTVGGDPEIAVLDVKTGETTIVTENRSKDLSPRWSPDGKTVAYVSDESGEMDINLFDAKGPRHHKIDPQWRPMINFPIGRRTVSKSRLWPRVAASQSCT